MAYPSSELVIDPVLIRKHDVSGPRYTSYPTADRFVEAFGEGCLLHRLEERKARGPGEPLSLYVHLPFCDTVCYYCGCNKVVTRDHGKSEKYINYLARRSRSPARYLARRARRGRRIRSCTGAAARRPFCRARKWRACAA